MRDKPEYYGGLSNFRILFLSKNTMDDAQNSQSSLGDETRISYGRLTHWVES